MAQNLLCKSLLALAVVAVHSQAAAVTIDLGGAPLTINTPYLESVTVTGSYSTTGPVPFSFPAINVSNGASLSGGLTLDANVFIESSVVALGFYSTPTLSLPVNGDLINLGVLEARGGSNASAMLLDPGRVNGSVINQGVLRASSTGAGPTNGATGLNVTTNQTVAASVSGDIENRGEIQVTSYNSTGLLLNGDAAIGGGLLNSGTIVVTGSDSRGMAVAGTASGLQINGVFENSGGISLESAASDSQSTLMLVFNAEVLGVTRNLGTLEGDGGARMGGISVVNGQVAGVSNGASGLIDSKAVSASGIYFEGSQATGLVSNQGDIRVTGSGSFDGFGTGSGGFSILNSQLDAGLSNSGSILGRGASSDSSATGIALADSSGSFLTNSGSLDIAGFQSSGIYLLDSQLSGGVLNSGDIQIAGSARADTAAGIVAVGSQIEGGIANTGTVTVSGDGLSGIGLRNGSASSVTNSGSISADGGAGIYLDGVSLPVLGNSGSISGSTYGIRLIGNSSGLQINHQGGLIAGGSAAILAENASLNWSGGTIRGDLDGLLAVNVLGEVLFDGGQIRASHVEVASASGDTPAGRLQLERSQTQVLGDFYLGNGSSLDMVISSANTNPTQAMLAVTGQAEFLAGSQVRLSASADDFSAKGSQYTLIRADSIVDGGLGVVSRSALLNVDSFSVDTTTSHTVTVVVSRKSDETIEQVLTGAGASGNAVSAALPFTNSVISQLDSSDPLFRAFANANPAELAALAEQLTPEVNGAATQAGSSSQSLISGVTSSRTAGAEQGMSSGDVLQQTGVWLMGLGSSADQDRRQGIAGFEARTQGVVIGADGKFNDQTSLGVAYARLNTQVKSATGNTTDVDGHTFTLYGGYHDSGYFLDGSLTYGINDNSGKRYVAGTRAKADFDSELLGINLLAGYGLRLAPELLLEPRLAARYSRIDIDSYAETGSAAALRVDAQRYEVAELGAGVRLAANVAAGRGSLEPEVRLMGYHDFIADQASSTSAFLLGGSPFVTAGAKPARSSYTVGIGLNYSIGALGLGVSYDYLGKQDFSADTLQAQLRYNF